MKFKDYICLKEGKENLEQPHIIAADPAMKIPSGIERLSEAFKKSKEVPIGKEVDSKAGGEKNVTLKTKKLYIVGGAVRDYLLGHTPRNYNLCTDAHPDEVEKIMQHAKPPIYVVKKDKGVVKVSVDGETYEIETMKKNGGEEEIFTTNPGEDLERRDFTINSLYYDIAGNKIIDHTGGLRHLKDNQVKFVGQAKKKMSEDGIRKHRYAFLVNKLPNAKVDDEIKDALMNAKSDDLPPDKVRDEFWKGLEDLHVNTKKYLKTYHDLGLLDTVFPDLELTMDFPDCKSCKSRPIVLAALLKNNKPSKLVSKLKELKYTDREVKDAIFLVNLLLFAPEYIYDFKKELIKSGLTKKQILDWAEVNKLDMNLIKKLLAYESQSQGDEQTPEVILRDMEAKAFMKKMKED